MCFSNQNYLFFLEVNLSQHCGGPVTHLHGSVTGAHVSPHPEPPSHLPPHTTPLGCPRALALNALLHASNLHWSSILLMVIYMFQCYSLISSQPRLLPHSPIVCSLLLCLFCPLCIGYLLLSF